MRIHRLDLRAVGPFTNVTLDLSEGDRGLHFILGPNEAGKSSCMRALEYALFGFPAKLSDDFVHAYGDLRVGATLENDAGAALRFLRRKRRDKTLFESDDETPLTEDGLRPFLGGLDSHLFRTFFGLGHSQLVEGGRAIASGDSEMGQVLFSATGLAQLQTVQSDLEKEAAELFLSSGKKPVLNQLLADWKQIRKEEKPLSHNKWNAARTALENSQKQMAEIEVTVESLQKQVQKLERIQKAIPLLAQRSRYVDQCKQLQTVRVLPDDFRDRRESIRENYQKAENSHQQAEQELERIENSLANIHVGEAFIEHQQAIETLYDRRVEVIKAANDRPELVANCQLTDQRIDAVIQKLNRNLAREDADQLRLNAQTRTRIAKLGSEYHAVHEASEVHRESLVAKQQALSAAESALTKSTAPTDVTALKAAYEAATRLGDTDAVAADTAADARASRAAAEQQVARLSGWTGSVDELASLSVPTIETIRKFVAEEDALQTAARDLSRELEDINQRLQQAQHELDKLRLEQDVPSEQQLSELRQARDEALGALFTARAKADSADLSAELESCRKQISAADEMADRLRREADRVAKRADREATQAILVKQLANCQSRQEELLTAKQEFDARWQLLWEPVGIAPQPAEEMVAWYLLYQNTIAEFDRSCELALKSDKAAATQQTQRQELAEQIRPFQGECTAQAIAPLTRIASAILEQQREIASARQLAKSDVARLQDEVCEAEQRFVTAENKLAQWQENWQAAISDLPLTDDAHPEEANQVLELIHEFEKLDEQSQAAHVRLQQMDEHAESFYQEARKLWRVLEDEASGADQSPDDVDLDELQRAVGRWVENSRDAVRSRDRRAELFQQREQATRVLQDATNGLETARRAIAMLCEEAGCDGEQQLREAEDRSTERRESLRKLDELEERLTEFTGGGSLQELADEAAGLDADMIPAMLDKHQQQLADDRKRLEEVKQSVWEQNHQWKQFVSDSQATAVAEQKQDLLVHIRTKAEEYARLRLASEVLKRGTEYYLQQHQGPVLRRASELFCRLTCESFTGLAEDCDDSGQPMILGVRNIGLERITIGQMSDGTADQLFLAIRLAWIESYLETHETIPLIVDDILIQFDDQRSRVVLQYLQELSNKTQVIFFTHHEHLLTLASSALAEDGWFAHALPGRNDNNTTQVEATTVPRVTMEK